MKRRFNMAVPLVFAFILTLLPFGLLEYNQFQRRLIRQERETNLWEQKAGNYLQLFRSLWSYESQIRRRMFLLHSHIKSLPAKDRYDGARFLDDLRSFFPAAHMPEIVYAGEVKDSGRRVEMFRGQGYSVAKLRVFNKLLEGLAREDTIPASELKSLGSMARGAFGNNLDFVLLKNNRRGKISRAIFSGAMKLVFWDSFTTAAGQKIVYLQVFSSTAVSRLDSMKLATSILGRRHANICSVLVPLEYADQTLKPVFDPYVPPEQRLLVDQTLTGIRAGKQNRNQHLPLGEFFDLNKTRVLRDFIDYSVPYEIWLLSRENIHQQRREPFIGFLLRLFYFSGWILVLTRVLITGRPIGISLKTWLTLIFVVVGILPLCVFFVAGIFHVDSAAYRREQEAIKDALQQLEEADASGEALLAEYRDLCQRLDSDREWVSLMEEWNESSWEKAWKMLPERFASAGLNIDALYVYPPDIASLPSRLFAAEKNAFDPEREQKTHEFYSGWIKRAYYELAPEVMIGVPAELPVFKGRTGEEVMRYFLSNRGDIEFLDLEDEKHFIYQNYISRMVFRITGISSELAFSRCSKSICANRLPICREHFPTISIQSLCSKIRSLK